MTILQNAGIDTDTGIEKLFAGAHDASAIAVCNGDAEVGVSFDDARSEAASECDLHTKAVVFAYGDEIPNDGIVVSGDLSAELNASIKQALLDYAATDDGKTVLETCTTSPPSPSPTSTRSKSSATPRRTSGNQAPLMRGPGRKAAHHPPQSCRDLLRERIGRISRRRSRPEQPDPRYR